MKRIFLTVTNDLTYDQRMDRICGSLAKAGYAVTLIGRKRRTSSPHPPKDYNTKRLFCFFETGKSFYLEYNLRLLLFLLFNRFDIVCGIDLDTLLPAWMAGKIKRKPIVYDAHEYFTEMEEIVSRPRVQKVWKKLERFLLTKIQYAYTISTGYARMFEEEYGKKYGVVRNITRLSPLPDPLPDGEYLLYQGAVNVGRGLEPLVEAMQGISIPLHICGKGDVYDQLQHQVAALGVDSKVVFHGYVKPEDLPTYTRKALIGFTLFSAKGLHHEYSMANRFFDYLHNGIPQIAMNYPEYRDFNQKYEVALLIDDMEPKTIEKAIHQLLEDKELYQRLRKNCLTAREEVNWAKESENLIGFYSNLVAKEFKA